MLLLIIDLHKQFLTEIVSVLVNQYLGEPFLNFLDNLFNGHW